MGFNEARIDSTELESGRETFLSYLSSSIDLLSDLESGLPRNDPARLSQIIEVVDLSITKRNRDEN